MLSIITSAIIALVISVGSLLIPYRQVAIQQELGANTTLPIAGTVYTLSGSGVSAAATSIGLTSLTIPQTSREIADSDLSDIFYITLEPGSRTRQELVSCTTVTQSGTDNTATLSGCVRGLLPFSPYTSSSTYAFAHAGGTSLVFSNPPQLYEEFTAKGNSAYITGIWTYASSSLPRVSSTPTYATGDELKFVTYGKLASTTAAGTVPLSESAAGIGIGANQIQMPLGTATGSSGGVNYQLLLQNRYALATSTATTTIPITMANGLISPSFISTSSPYIWSATSTFTGPLIASSTITLSTTTFTGIPTLPAINPATGNQATRKTYVDTFIPLLDATSTDYVVTGQTTSTVYSVSIPANTLIGENALEITTHLYLGDTNAETSTYYVLIDYGGVSISSSTITQNGVGNWDYEFVHLIMASSSAIQQNFVKSIGPLDNSSTGSVTSTIRYWVRNSSSIVDATQAQTYTIRLRHNSTNQLSTAYYTIVKKFGNQ